MNKKGYPVDNLFSLLRNNLSLYKDKLHFLTNKGIKKMKEDILQFSYEKLLPSVPFHKLKIDVDLLEVRKFFTRCSPIRGVMLSFGKEDVEEGRIRIHNNQLILDDTVLYCDVFQEFSSCQICTGIAYLASCNTDSFEEYGIGQLNYHFIQNSCLDLVRNMIMQNFRLFTYEQLFTIEQRSVTEQVSFTKAFGPGYYGMQVEEGEKLHKLLHGERLGVRYEDGMMHPLKSTIGAAFSYRGKETVKLNPCDFCESNGEHCMFCGGL